MGKSITLKLLVNQKAIANCGTFGTTTLHGGSYNGKDVGDNSIHLIVRTIFDLKDQEQRKSFSFLKIFLFVWLAEYRRK